MWCSNERMRPGGMQHHRWQCIDSHCTMQLRDHALHQWREQRGMLCSNEHMRPGTVHTVGWLILPRFKFAPMRVR